MFLSVSDTTGVSKYLILTNGMVPTVIPLYEALSFIPVLILKAITTFLDHWIPLITSGVVSATDSITVSRCVHFVK
jgi:hypothetical protein